MLSGTLSVLYEESGAPSDDRIRDLFPFMPGIIGPYLFIHGNKGDKQRPGEKEWCMISSTIESLNIDASSVSLLMHMPAELRTYLETCNHIMNTFRKERSDPLQKEFLADTGSIVKRIVMARQPDLSSTDAIEARSFKNAMDSAKNLSYLLGDGKLKRCTSCGLIGNKDVHFRKVKVAGKWGQDELCLYCNRYEWYHSQGV